MAARRQQKPYETGDAKMKAAAIKSVQANDDPAAIPSPARQLQDQLHAHYRPLSKQMSVILVSLLVAFAFIGGWLGGAGNVAFV
jgi:hypothetical protein